MVIDLIFLLFENQRKLVGGNLFLDLSSSFEGDFEVVLNERVGSNCNKRRSKSRLLSTGIEVSIVK